MLERSVQRPAHDLNGVSYADKARNAAEFVRGLGYPTIDVLGFWMGGFVAQVEWFLSSR